MAKRIIIVGAGAAGLAAAVSLASKGVETVVFESKSFPGGRMFSFRDESTGSTVDNGQHLMTGFYYHTLKLLELIGSSDHTARQRSLSVDFLKKGGECTHFKCANLTGPLHFLSGLFRYKDFPKKDIWGLIVAAGKLRKNLDPRLSALDFLKVLRQSDESIRLFFRPLALATLNADLEQISGRLFQKVLHTILKAPAADSALIFPTVGLSDFLAVPAMKYIEGNGGEVRLGTPISSAQFISDKIISVTDCKNGQHRADGFIFALPPYALARILPRGEMSGLEDWRYSPIVSVNIWYDRPVVGRMMTGFLGSRFHWCFDRAEIAGAGRKHAFVTLLISAAYHEAGMPKEKLVEIARDEMKSYFEPARTASVIHAQVIKEHRATVVITPNHADKRPHAGTKWRNLMLAGDWTETELPATIESAVKSGFIAAELVV